MKRGALKELRGASRLAIDATERVTSVVESMHQTIASGPAVLGRPFEVPARIMTKLAYGSVRAVTRRLPRARGGRPRSTTASAGTE